MLIISNYLQMDTNVNIKEREEVRAEISAASPFLAKTEKKNPFSVPENYFENFPLSIGEKCRKSTTIISRKWIPEPRLAFALCCIILLMVTGIKLSTRDNVPAQAGSSPESAILSLSYEDLCASGIISELGEDDIMDPGISSGISSGKKTNENEIEEYLISNHVDISTIAASL